MRVHAAVAALLYPALTSGAVIEGVPAPPSPAIDCGAHDCGCPAESTREGACCCAGAPSGTPVTAVESLGCGSVEDTVVLAKRCPFLGFPPPLPLPAATPLETPDPPAPDEVPDRLPDPIPRRRA